MLPLPERGRDGPRPSPALISLLKVLLAAKCEQNHVAARLVAIPRTSSGSRPRIAPNVPALHGWRRDVFGADALALKDGRIGLGVEGRRIRLLAL